MRELAEECRNLGHPADGNWRGQWVVAAGGAAGSRLPARYVVRESGSHDGWSGDIKASGGDRRLRAT